MILTGVSVVDYGAFRGRCSFDLSCTEERPLVLFGGDNGAGKTTIFESIMLCLYGAGSLPGRTTKKAYASLLAGRTHRRPGQPEPKPSVEVRFVLAVDGQEAEYRVVRSWNADGSGEGLELSRRGRDGEFAPVAWPGHLQEAVDGMIPPEVMRLFFVDGERVARMAEDGTADGAVAEAFGSLLGLDVVEQLRADLHTSLVRSKKAAGGDGREEYGRLKSELGVAENDRERLLGKLHDARADLAAVRDDVAAAENAISRMGGGFASRKEAAKAELAEAKTAHAAACKSILNLCDGALPFMLVSERMRRLRAAILDDEDAQRRAAGRALLDDSLDGLAGRLGAGAFANMLGLSAADAAKAAGLVEKQVAAVRSGLVVEDPPLGLSRRQAAGMTRVAEEAAAGPPAELSGLAAEAVRLDGDIAELNKELAASPEDVDLAPLVAEAGSLNAKAGTIQAGMGRMAAELEANGEEVARLKSGMKGALSKVFDAEAAERGVDITRRVQGVLEEFAAKLRSEKAKLLEGNVREAVDILMHKGLVEDVKVDPEGFGVTLYGRGGAVPKDTLSAGERQVLATALLWALAKTSGHPLPFAVDTPLARLDGRHRETVVGRFLPAASHQVLVFSTDAEIGMEEYGRLEPCMARSYMLEHSGTEGRTTHRLGYFHGGGDAP